MAKIIWDSGENPNEYVSKRLGIKDFELRAAIHKIKRANGLQPTDDIKIWDDGSVTDANGEFRGNIHDEL